MLSFAGLRTKLREGQWSEVAEALNAALQTSETNLGLDRNEVLRVISTLSNTARQDLWTTRKFSLMVTPLGSGSIEGAIRRVVNLRMKGNGTFWRVSKAERILVLRSSILSGIWDEDRQRVKLQSRIKS